LKIQPKTRAGIEVPGQSQGLIRSYAAPLVDNLRDSSHRHPQIDRQPIHAQSQRLHEIGAQNLAWMNGRTTLLSLSHVTKSDSIPFGGATPDVWAM
jgi:hypothetical protein